MIETDVGYTIDSRRMCFEQGKVFVYMSADRKEIIAEVPNGVVVRHLRADDTYVRTWPDGCVDRYRKGDPEYREFPYVPPSGKCPKCQATEDPSSP